MADVPAASAPQAERRPRNPLGGLVAQTEIDLRLFGMVVALIVIVLGFGYVTNGQYTKPENLISLSVQAAGVAIMATGMVLIIVTRNIDLSVGSIVGVVAMSYALLMTQILPNAPFNIALGSPFMWIIALAIGLLIGAAIGGIQGFIIAYIGVPSFIVTLGGLFFFRGLTWVLSSGASVAGLDPTFQLLGGGPLGSIGGPMSLAVGVAVSAGVLLLLAYNRRRRRKFGFTLRPIWAETLLGVVGVLVTLGLVLIANRALWPPPLVQRYATENNIEIPAGGLEISAGIPWPLVIVLIVTLAMTFLATRRRFGRYVYAYGGNPEGAELAGINTRFTILKVYILMGLLCGISAAIASARLNSATLDVGSGSELFVIAAAVVGGTSFAGGIGTISGAVLGALVMASIVYGLSLVGLSSPIQNMVLGLVVILVVGFDAWNRRRSA